MFISIATAYDLLKGNGIKLDFTDGKGNFGGLDKMLVQLGKLNKLPEGMARITVAETLLGCQQLAEQLLWSALLTQGGAGGSAGAL